MTKHSPWSQLVGNSTRAQRLNLEPHDSGQIKVRETMVDGIHLFQAAAVEMWWFLIDRKKNMARSTSLPSNVTSTRRILQLLQDSRCCGKTYLLAPGIFPMPMPRHCLEIGYAWCTCRNKMNFYDLDLNVFLDWIFLYHWPIPFLLLHVSDKCKHFWY